MSVRSTLPAAEPRRKENQFVNKRGRKHHNYPPGKAPYPISYDRDLLDRQLSLNSTSTLSLTSKPAMLWTITCGEASSTAGRR